MKNFGIIFILFSTVCFCTACKFNFEKNESKQVNKYDTCELGDLVGDDVERIQIKNFFIDYHKDDFTKDQIIEMGNFCINDGVETQFQMDCCMTRKMYPEE